jgi:hypothetical protein
MNTKNTTEHSVEVNESEISVVAYQKWEQAGHPSDRNLQFWLDAEAQVRAAGKGQLGPNQPNSPKPGQKLRKP